MTKLEDLMNLWTKGKFPQASLLISRDQEVALSMVKQFATKIFHEETKIPLENNPDFQIIEKVQNDDEIKKEITIDQIRKARCFLSNTAAISNSKILVVYQAESLNLNAANACLKMLEEPGCGSYIFLITYYQNAILDTLKSRCAIFNINAFSQSLLNQGYDNFLPKNTDELFKMASELALKKNLNLWNLYNISALELVSHMVKISSGILQDDLPAQLNFRSYNAHYLIYIYNRVKQVIEDTNMYELDKKQSVIMIYELVNCFEFLDYK